MNKNQIFSAIAQFYEYSMKNNCDYQKWSQYVLDKVKKYSPSNNGIDVACGSGYFTRTLKLSNYNVSGVDISNEMLTQANNIACQNRLNIPFYQGDMTNLKSQNKVGFITAINDAINYVPTQKLEKTFKSFYNCLIKNGIVIFDFSSERRLKNTIGNNTFFEDENDYSYIWYNTLFEDRVEMDMSIFTKQGELYKKTTATVTEYIHKLDCVKKALINAKFEIIEIENDFEQIFSEEKQRINVVAKKI